MKKKSCGKTPAYKAEGGMASRRTQPVPPAPTSPPSRPLNPMGAGAKARAPMAPSGPPTRPLNPAGAGAKARARTSATRATLANHPLYKPPGRR